MDKELFIKYLNNQCTGEETEKVIAWFSDSKSSGERRKLLKELWNDEGVEDFEADVNFNALLDRIHHDINIEESRSVKKVPERKIGKVINLISRVAAILLIPLLVYNVYTFQKERKEIANPVYSKVFAPNGSRTTFELPDGTKVWLNSGSSLKFPQKFAGKTRNVELKGEAYFEVVHNPSKPMIVKADKIFVKVLGTKFNVMNYNDSEVEVALLEGSVSLNRYNSSKKLREVIKLKPGQLAVYRKKEHKVSYGTVNVNKYIAWTKGVVMFENDPLSSVAQRLGRAFNVDVIIKDKEISDYTFTATFVDESLPQIMKLIKLALPVKYRIEKSKKMPDGTFTKTKVIIQKR